MLVVGVDGCLDHILRLVTDGHFVWLAPAGTEDRAAISQDTGKLIPADTDNAVVDQSSEAVTEPDDRHSQLIDRGLADAPDRRI